MYLNDKEEECSRACFEKNFQFMEFMKKEMPFLLRNL